MILLTAGAFLFVVHLVLIAGSRGTREHFMFSTGTGQSLYLDLMKDLDEAGVPGVDLTGPLQDIEERGLRGRVTLANIGPPVLVIAAGFGISAIPGVPAPVGAILAALILAFQPAFERWQLIMTGNARELPEQSGPERWITVAGRAIGAGVIWLTLSMAYTGPVAVQTFTDLDGWPAVLLGSAGLLAGLWLAYLVMRLSRRVAQRFAPKTGFELQAGPDTVLYLRSFGDDDLQIQTPVTDSQLRALLWPSVSFEEYLSFCTRGDGLLVTVGRPGEGLPRPGAVRAYYSPDKWQDRIRLTTQRAGHIILTTGATRALSWEISNLRAWGVLSKCLFLIPPLKPDRSSERVGLLLRALQVPDTELTRAEAIGVSTAVAVRVRDDNTVEWFNAPGRDWAAYVAAFALHRTQTERTPRQQPAPPGAEAPEPIPLPKEPSTAAIPERPRRAPKAVRKAVWWTILPEVAFQRNRNDRAFDGFRAKLAEYRAQPRPDRQAMAYLMIRCLAAADAAGRTDDVASLLEQTEQLVRGMGWVWVDTMECWREEKVRTGLLEILADVRESAGDHAGAVDAGELRLEAAHALRDRREQLQAAVDLAVLLLTSNPTRARELAEAARRGAADLGDIERQGTAIQLLATLRQNAHDPGASSLFEEASGYLAHAGETERAANLLGLAADEAANHGNLERAYTLLEATARCGPAKDEQFQQRVSRDFEILEATRRASEMLDPPATALLAAAQQLAHEHHSWATGTGHLLLAALDSSDPAITKLLQSQMVDAGWVRVRLASLLRDETCTDASASATGATRALRTLIRTVVQEADRRGTTISAVDVLAAFLEAPSGVAAVALKPPTLFERFTDRTRRVVVLGHDEARALAHLHIDTEHLLLGLIDEGSGRGVRVLSELGIPMTLVRQRLEARLAADGSIRPTGTIPFTAAVREALRNAEDERSEFGHPLFGTEHLLLGLTGEVDGVAAQILEDLGVDLQSAREVIERLTAADDWSRPAGPVPAESLEDVLVRYSPGARAIVILAEDETRLLEHPWIGTENLLLGLIRGASGQTKTILTAAGISLGDARAEVEEIWGRGERRDVRPEFTPGGAQMVRKALHTALRDQRRMVETRHFASELLSFKNPRRVLTGLGIDLDTLQREISVSGSTERDRPKADGL